MAQWLGHCESHSKLRPKITAGFAAARKVRAHTPRFVPYHRGDFPISQWAMQLGVVMGAIRPPGNPPLLLLVVPGLLWSLDQFFFIFFHSQVAFGGRLAPWVRLTSYIRPTSGWHSDYRRIATYIRLAAAACTVMPPLPLTPRCGGSRQDLQWPGTPRAPQKTLQRPPPLKFRPGCGTVK